MLYMRKYLTAFPCKILSNFHDKLVIKRGGTKLISTLYSSKHFSLITLMNIWSH